MSQFYYYVWGLYGIAALGLFYLAWLVLRHIKVAAISHALLALFMAVLFTPAKMIPEQADLTPALMVALFDGIVEGWSGVWAGLKYILLVYLGLLAILLLVYLLKAVLRPKQKLNQDAESPSVRE